MNELLGGSAVVGFLTALAIAWAVQQTRSETKERAKISCDSCGLRFLPPKGFQMFGVDESGMSLNECLCQPCRIVAHRGQPVHN